MEENEEMEDWGGEDGNEERKKNKKEGRVPRL